MGVLRARRGHLRAGFQQCKSFVEMCTVRCCPLWHPAHVIGGVENTLPEGCPGTTTGVSHYWFSGHFRQVFFNTNALPRINIGADVWVESSIMTGVYQCWCSSTLDIRWGLCDRVCSVLVCRGRYGIGGGFFSSFWDRIWAE